MKLSKSSNTWLSVVMILCILTFSIGTFIAISASMKTVYIDAIKDMISVAIGYVDEQIQINMNECNFIGKTNSFVNFITFCEEDQQLSAAAKTEYNTIFDYIYTKTQSTKNINKISYADTTRKIMLSSDTNEVNTYINKNSFYSDNATGDIANISIEKSDEGENLILITQPIKLYDKNVGYLFMELNFDFIDSFLKNYKFGTSGNLFLITNKLNFIGQDDSLLPNSISDIKNSSEINALLASNASNRARVYTTEFKTDVEDRYMVYSTINKLNCIVASSINMNEVHQSSFKTAFPMVFLMLVIFVMLIVYRYIISRKILRPLSLLNRSLYLLKKGDLRARYNYNVEDEFGNLSCVFNQTISNLQNTTLDLKKRESKNNIILGNVTDVIWEYNLEMDTIKMPENWSKLIGVDYAKADYLYTVEALLEYVHFNDREDLKTHVKNCIAQNEPFNIDIKIKRHDESYVWVRVNGACMYNIYNEPYQVIGSMFDITEDKKREDKLKASATRDDMTLLLKKVEMERLIDIDIAETTYEHSLMIIDLDEFKSINDTYGHLAGDEIILHTADTLRMLCGESCYLCRFGGDEFIVYTKDYFSKADTAVLAQDIIKELNKGCTIHDGNRINIRCSIGISTSPIDGSNYVHLISKADDAIYRVKKSEKNNYAFFS